VGVGHEGQCGIGAASTMAARPEKTATDFIVICEIWVGYQVGEG
jgi:hypothetical protein